MKKLIDQDLIDLTMIPPPMTPDEVIFRKINVKKQYKLYLTTNNPFRHVIYFYVNVILIL